MQPSNNNNLQGLKEYTYLHVNTKNDEEEKKSERIPKQELDKLLENIGKEILKDEIPRIEVIAQKLLDGNTDDILHQSHTMNTNDYDSGTANSFPPNPTSLIVQLKKSGYLKDSPKCLTRKGFLAVGGKLLQNIMKILKNGEFGLHEVTYSGSGSLTLDTSKAFEPGDDLNLIDVPKSVLNAVQRISRTDRQISIPIDVTIDDFEQHETKQEVNVAIAYCIDLSSTMRYSTMYEDTSRIGAAKKALWSLYLLNQRYFPSDSIYIIGFGALASKISPYDIPYLRTFEPGTDFLHYTNYQAAFRLAQKILQKDMASNKRMVLITDGHPSACFIDDDDEKQKILSLRPFSQFYIPEKETVEQIRKSQDLQLDLNSGKSVYLCYRYRQVDQYIGEKTILEAKKCRNTGIEIDTIMISEENSLLGYINEMEKIVKGRSYYIKPSEIDKMLITDYLNNKKITYSSK